MTTEHILNDLKACFSRLFITDLLFKGAAFVFLTPLTSWVLQQLIRTSGTSAVSNTEIITFLLSPFGIFALLAGGTITFALIFAEQTGLLIIAGGAHFNMKISWQQAVALAVKRMRDVLGLGAIVTLSVISLVLPVVLICGLLYLHNLTEFDINYYLQTFPPEFQQTLFIAIPLVIGLALLLGYLYINWSFALSAILFKGVHFRHALRYSRKIVRGAWIRVAVILLGWLSICAVLGLLSHVILALIGDIILTVAGDRFQALVLFMGMLILFNGAISVLLTFAGLAGSVLLTVHLFYELSGQDKHTIELVADADACIKQKNNLLTGKKILTGLLISLILTAIVSWQFLKEFDSIDNTTVTVTAHRGSSLAAPPNTLSSIQAAIDDGADYVEFDVQETADGVIVLNHDRDFMLAAGVPLAVHDASFAEIRALDVGSSFSSDFSGEQVPSLAEVLELTKGKIKVNIELKYYGYDKNLAERVVQFVREKNMVAETVIMSLNYAKIQELKQQHPDIVVGFLSSAITAGDLTRLNVDFLAVSSSLARANLVQKAHKRDKKVFVWTINQATEIFRYMERGVDSIITDKPALAREVIENRKKMSRIERLFIHFSFSLRLNPFKKQEQLNDKQVVQRSHRKAVSPYA